MLLTCLISLASLSSTSPLPRLLTGIGDYHRPVGTSRPLAQKYFDQGLALFYAFHKAQSAKFFEAATTVDPRCAMAWWGRALAEAPDINFGDVDDAAATRAVAAIAMARRFAKPGLESELVQAQGLRYVSPAPKNRSQLDKAYADRMRWVYKRHPSDPDVACLFAEALMILNPWHQWEPDGRPVTGTLEAVAAIRHALALSPRHLMANHLLVHVLEGSNHPEQALRAADLLCNLAPSLGHLVHMPSHIYVRVGYWGSAITQNRKAIVSDRAFAKARGASPTYLPYTVHNRMMLAYAAMMNGAYSDAAWALGAGADAGGDRAYGGLRHGDAA